MKKIILFTLFSLFTIVGFSQNSGITYQAVIYNPSGEALPGYDNQLSPMVETDICLRFSIYGNGLEYEETVQTTTDKFGMVNIKIGTNGQSGGSAGSIGDVNWDSGEKSMRVELNPNGNCNSFEEISYQAFSYVPFAYYAQNDVNTAAIEANANAIDDLQADVDQNEADSDAAIAALQADVDQNEADSDAADADLQAQIDAEGTDLELAIAAVQADVDQNETDSDAGDAALQAAIDAAVAEATTAIINNAVAIATNTNSIAVVQADVDQNETDSDTADAALWAAIDAAVAEATNAITNNAVAIATNTNSIAVVQADVDQNETDSDTADALVWVGINAAMNAITNTQADVDQNEADSDAADTALQAELDGTQMDVSQQYGLILTLESDVDNLENTIAVVQEDVNQNEADSDAADAALQTAIDAVQADVDQNEADTDTSLQAATASIAILNNQIADLTERVEWLENLSLGIGFANVTVPGNLPTTANILDDPSPRADFIKQTFVASQTTNITAIIILLS